MPGPSRDKLTEECDRLERSVAEINAEIDRLGTSADDIRSELDALNEATSSLKDRRKKFIRDLQRLEPRPSSIPARMRRVLRFLKKP